MFWCLTSHYLFWYCVSRGSILITVLVAYCWSSASLYYVQCLPLISNKRGAGLVRCSGLKLILFINSLLFHCLPCLNNPIGDLLMCSGFHFTAVYSVRVTACLQHHTESVGLPPPPPASLWCCGWSRCYHEVSQGQSSCPTRGAHPLSHNHQPGG